MSNAATTYGMSGPLEHARIAMDVVQNVLLPYEDAIYTASHGYLMAFGTILVLIWVLIKMMSADGKAAAKTFGIFCLVLFMTFPVTVNFDNPLLWHDYGGELSSPSATYQPNGATACRGVLDDKDPSGMTPAVPNCSSYRVSFGALSFFAVTNTIEDLLYSAVGSGISSLGGNVHDVPAGAYEALSIPPDGLARNPDTNKLYRTYVDTCTPIAVADQHSASPLDPRAWYSLGLLGGGGLGVNLIYLAPDEFVTAATTSGVFNAGVMAAGGSFFSSTGPSVASQAGAALDEMNAAPDPAGPLEPIAWFHIPSESFWEQQLTTGVEPSPDYTASGKVGSSSQLVPFNPSQPFGSSTALDINEFSSPDVKHYLLSLAGVIGSKVPPPPPQDTDAWYAYNCFDLYALTHIAFENYYNAEKEVLTNANSFCATGCLRDPSVVQASEVGTESELTAEMKAMSDEVEKKTGGELTNGDAVIANVQAGKSWIGTIFGTYFTLPLVVATAIGAACYGLGFLFFLSPLIFVAALVPGRGATIGTWMKGVVYLKTTIFLMYVITALGGFLIAWTQINQAAGMWGGHAGSWRYAALSYSTQGLILGAVTVGAPLLAYMIVFHATNRLATHAHHHINVALSAAGGYIVGKGIRNVTSSVGREIRHVRSERASAARAADREQKAGERFEQSRADQNKRFDEHSQQTRAQVEAGLSKIADIIEQGGELRRREVFSKDGSKTVSSTFAVKPSVQQGGGNTPGTEPIAGSGAATNKVFGDVKKMGMEGEARDFDNNDDKP